MTPAVKYLVTKLAASFIYETLECSRQWLCRGFADGAALLRGPLNAIWEGSGTVVALDVLRVLRRDREWAETMIVILLKRAALPEKPLPLQSSKAS